MFTKNIKNELLQDLNTIVLHAQTDMRRDPEYYIGPDDLEPIIDVRLTMDVKNKVPFFSFKTGSVQYDTSHSDYCGASIITLDTNPVELLDDLIDDIEFQMGELDDEL